MTKIGLFLMLYAGILDTFAKNIYRIKNMDKCPLSSDEIYRR